MIVNGNSNVNAFTVDKNGNVYTAEKTTSWSLGQASSDQYKLHVAVPADDTTHSTALRVLQNRQALGTSPPQFGIQVLSNVNSKTGTAVFYGVHSELEGTYPTGTYVAGRFTCTGAGTNIALQTNQGGVQFGILAGGGDQMVVTDNNGNLSTQAIPGGGGGGGTVSGTASYIAKFSSGSGVEEARIFDDGSGNIEFYNQERFRKKTKVILVEAATTIWDMNNGNNVEVTLTADRTLQINNVQIGDYGTLVIKQGNSNGNNLTMPLNSIFTGGSNVQGDKVFCTINGIDVASFYYDGTNYFWTIGYDYQ
jgi:hypothetical protein